MPGLLDITKSVAFILGHDREHDIEEGRQLLGTAFIVDVGVDASDMVLITARHLLTRRQNVRANDDARFARVNLEDGTMHEMALPMREEWCEHPTSDVAVCRVGLPANWDGYAHSHSSLPTTDQLNSLIDDDVVKVGAQITFAGLFSPIPGGEKILPVFRFGRVSLLPPNEGVKLKIQQEEITSKAFLVEAFSHGGFSGSPTFLIDANDEAILLGLISSHFALPEYAQDDEGEALAWGVKLNTGMAAVIPSTEVRDAITDFLQME